MLRLLIESENSCVLQDTPGPSSLSRVARLISLLLIGGASTACHETPGGGDSYGTVSDANAEDDAEADSANAASDENSSEGEDPKLDLGGDDSSGGDEGCSPDLQHTTDLDGNFIEDCEPDEGCYMGECIPACEAAALSEGSIGCEYYVATPPFYENELGDSTFDGSCHAVMVANTWGRPAMFSLAYAGADLDVGQHAYIPQGIGPEVVYNPLPADGIPVGQVAIVFVSHEPDANSFGMPLNCPVEPAYIGSPAAVGTGTADAFELLSDTPITVYDIMPYGGASTNLPSASLLVPRTAWGDNYVLPTPHYATGKLWANVTAREDATQVTISVTGTVIDGTIEVPPIAQSTSYVLDAGEILQWTSTEELAGSIIQSDKPIGVSTGNTYLRVPTVDSPSGGGHDAAHQQISHVQALGTHYVGLGIPTRKSDDSAESVMYRIVGVVDGTTLTYDPAPPTNAPLSLDTGEVAEFETTELYSVASQDEDHPFAFTQYMSGMIDLVGDEEWVNLLAPTQYLRHYAFFVDPTYLRASLALVRVLGPEGFEEVDVECYGPVDGWEAIGSDGAYEVAHIDLYVDGTGPCAQSQHLASSDAPFGIVVWGLDVYASYAYPAGGNAHTLNDVIVDPG